MDNDAIFRVILQVSGDYDIRTTRQRPANGLESLASHNNRLAHGQAFEVPHVGRQVPRQLVVSPDNTIFRHRRNDGDNHKTVFIRTIALATSNGNGCLDMGVCFIADQPEILEAEIGYRPDIRIEIHLW